MILLIDGDSLAYMAGAGANLEDVEDIVDVYMDRILNKSWDSRYELYIEARSSRPKNIFRNHVAITRPYKGNRAPAKPEHLDYAKAYMIGKWKATVQTHVESEDVVLMRATELGKDNFMIVTIDKDLRQMPGQFYDYRKDETYRVSEEEARLNFWGQVLTGDPVDNIPGLPGVGPKKAAGVLRKSKNDELSLATAVATEYQKAGFNYAYFVEQCRLLRLLRSPTEVYIPPIKF